MLRGLIAVTGIVVAGFASAAPYISSTGLVDADVTLTFESPVFSPGTVITTEYASSGVTFSPNVYYDSQGAGGAPFPGISGAHYLGNFAVGPAPDRDPFSILFTNDVTDAVFGFATNLTTTSFSAFLDGVLVETFALTTTLDNPPNAFLGFQNSLFDEIKIDVTPDAVGVAVFDNLQFNLSSVPEPTALALLGIALAGLGFARRKRTAT